MTELKPCPFCGSTAHITDFGFSQDVCTYAIYCDKCNASVGAEANEKEVAELWNRRVSDWIKETEE